MPHERFHYKTLDEVKTTAAALGVDLPLPGTPVSWPGR